MARANFGLAVATVSAITAFGVKPAEADIWHHQGTGNTSFATSELMTGNVTGIRVNISGDNLWAFTGIAESQFITITTGVCNQPGVLSLYDKNSNPFAIGSGYHDLTLSGFNMTVDIGAENVGQLVTFAFGNYGTEAMNGSTSLYDLNGSGQISPLVVAPWNATGGQNQFGSETREYQISGIAGVPTVGTLAPLALAGLVATRRRR